MTAAGDDGEAARRRKRAELGSGKDGNGFDANGFVMAARAARWTQDEIDGELRRALEEAPHVEPDDGNIVRLDIIRGGGEGAAESAPEAALVLDLRAPLDVAQRLVERDHTLRGAPTLHHWRDSWVCWNGRSSYEILRERAVRTWLYEALARSTQACKGHLERVKPKRGMVTDIIDALKAAVALEDRIEPPAWLGAVADRPPACEFVAVRNGLVHLPSRELWPPDPSFFAFGAAGIDYDPEAPEPAEWLAFLRKLWPDDQASIETLQEILGYLISAETAQQKIFFLHGVPRSGKGTIGRVVTQLLGPGRVAAPGLGDFGARFGLESLVGKSVAIVADARLSKRADQAPIVEKMLSISGEDAITVDRKYSAPWCGRLGTRLLLLSNEIPSLRDTACALPNRFVVLKLSESFFGREDLKLGGRLLAELSGIFNWGLDGADRLRARGHFVQPESAAELIRTMKALASPLEAFLDARCLRSKSLEIKKDRLRQAYSEWCAEQGEEGQKAQLTKTKLTQELQSLGIFPGQSRALGDLERDRVWVYKGVDLRQP